ncbi:hypothetical protein WR25_22587 [Diploscapter pachys]|uniref:Uncharacterized protein n=1 Tax=Diploscapter pachys TaxID=2018661 RepID=A0A2A2KJQ0_9BILA|nr:hypothetical protein WR25_22587 [Diploscapter pachys]
MRLLEGNGRSLEFLRRKVNFCICDGQGARQSAGRVADILEMSQLDEKEANWTGNSNGVRWNLTEAEIEAARQNMHNGSQEEKANGKHNEQGHSQRLAIICF